MIDLRSKTEKGQVRGVSVKEQGQGKRWDQNAPKYSGKTISCRHNYMLDIERDTEGAGGICESSILTGGCCAGALVRITSWLISK